MKIVGASILLLIAVFAVLNGIVTPSSLAEQVARERIYYQQFEILAAYVNVNGRLPNAESMDTWLDQSGGMSIHYFSLHNQPFECGPDFTKASSDRFVLEFWRGEWFECYAYPSGKTTMPMSVSGYLGIWYWVNWLVALASAWGAWLLIRSWRSKRQAAGSGA